MSRPRMGFVVALTVYAVAMRLLPYVLNRFGLSIDPATTTYPWNFSPLTALCLFGAACFAHRRWAFALPVIVMTASNLGIWALTGAADFVFVPSLIVVYAAFLLTTALGLWLRRWQSPEFWRSDRTSLQRLGTYAAAVGGTGIVAETVFFVVTNFAMWAGQPVSPWVPVYSQDLAGLSECYVMALPFFRNSLISTVVFSGILFSLLAVAKREPAKSVVSAPVVSASV